MGKLPRAVMLWNSQNLQITAPTVMCHQPPRRFVTYQFITLHRFMLKVLIILIIVCLLLLLLLLIMHSVYHNHTNGNILLTQLTLLLATRLVIFHIQFLLLVFMDRILLVFMNHICNLLKWSSLVLLTPRRSAHFLLHTTKVSIPFNFLLANNLIKPKAGKEKCIPIL